MIALWLLAGLCLALVVSQVGVVTVPVGLVLVVLLVRRDARRWPALLVGLGLLPLYVGWLNRSGPGVVCTTTPHEQSCVEQLAPAPWFAVGAVLVALGVALTLRAARGAHPDGRRPT